MMYIIIYLLNNSYFCELRSIKNSTHIIANIYSNLMFKKVVNVRCMVLINFKKNGPKVKAEFMHK
jgi:hypothetical protein